MIHTTSGYAVVSKDSKTGVISVIVSQNDESLHVYNSEEAAIDSIVKKNKKAPEGTKLVVRKVQVAYDSEK